MTLLSVAPPRGYSYADPMSGARRIALISSSYHPYPGGVEEHTRNVARELRHRGHPLEVWTVDRGEHLGVQSVDGITVRYLPTPLPARTPRALASFAWRALPAWGAWESARRGFRPDVLHVQCFGPNGLYALALHTTHRLPLIVSSHGETFADDHGAFEQSRLLVSGLRGAGREASAITGCSEVVLDDLAHRFGIVGGSVVPNGIDLDEAARVAAEPPPFDPTVPTVFAVGRVERVKGFDLLLRAFARAALPDARLVIGGDGGALPGLRALAAELGVADRVGFPGRLGRGAVIAGMASATVNVVPSRREAFGIVVLEAWRSGRPLIATDREGPGTLVTDGVDGLLVDPENPDAFAAALRRILTDADLAARLARAGRETVRSYTWDAVVDRYLELYDRSLSRQPR